MIKNILLGIKAYFGALSLVSKLKLWKYFVIPILISFVIAISIGLLSYNLSDDMGHYLAHFWKWEFGKQTFQTISRYTSAFVIIVIGLLVYKHLVMALSAPFMSPVSEKIEQHLTRNNHIHRNTTFLEQLIRGVKINSRNLVKEILLTIPILVLGFIPIIGLSSGILLFLLQSYYAGFGNMDYTLERHLNYKDSINFVQKNRGVAIGNGIVFMLCLLVPVIGVILVLPLSVTAASIKTIELLNNKTI